MSRTAFLAFALPLFVALGCSPPPRYVKKSHGPPMYVKTWVDPASPLPPLDVLAGCNVWNEADIYCTLVPDRDDADVRVLLSPHKCEKNEDDAYVLATASSDRKIEVRWGCFANGKEPNLERLRLSMAHEFGHQWGIWKHVEVDCPANPERGPDGTAICGRALMNANENDSPPYLTPADIAALARRDTHPKRTVLPRPRINNESTDDLPVIKMD